MKKYHEPQANNSSCTLITYQYDFNNSFNYLPVIDPFNNNRCWPVNRQKTTNYRSPPDSRGIFSTGKNAGTRKPDIFAPEGTKYTCLQIF